MPRSLLTWVRCVPLVQTIDGGWRPGIGDPTCLGWFTVVAYFAAAYACWRAFARARTHAAAPRQLPAAWQVLCLGMLALGINKQLDLQSLVTVVGRNLALHEGWYAGRRPVQIAFIRAVSLLALVAMLIFAFWLRRCLRDIWLAALGGVFIAAFVVIRAASFHHVDTLLRHTYFGLRMNFILELSGIACIAVSALLYLRRAQPSLR